jgi:hypothetical protein
MQPGKQLPSLLSPTCSLIALAKQPPQGKLNMPEVLNLQISCGCFQVFFILEIQLREFAV